MDGRKLSANKMVPNPLSQNKITAFNNPFGKKKKRGGGGGGKEKALITSIFSFSNNVFSP